MNILYSKSFCLLATFVFSLVGDATLKLIKVEVAVAADMEGVEVDTAETRTEVVGEIA